MSGIEERILGGLYGALVGDALGVPVEFSTRARRDADPVADLRGWGTWNQRPGTWSDDGALLLCGVEALCESWDMERMGALFVRWARQGHWAARGEVFDIGVTTDEAIGRLAVGCPPELAGGDDESNNGNGSLMRILPVALRYASEDDTFLAQRAMAASCLTHAHIRSQLACAFLCLFAKRLLAGFSPREAYAGLRPTFATILAAHPEEAGHFARLLSGSLGEVARSGIGSGGYVMETLEASIWCLLQGNTYAEATLLAVNLGGDTDTTGCVTGGLAGLQYGISGVPMEWRETLPRGAELSALFERYLRNPSPL